MRPITQKQKKALYHLISFLNQNENEFGSDDHDAKVKLQHITNMAYSDQLNHLTSTGKNTQSIFKFLIAQASIINQFFSEFSYMYPTDPNM